MRLYYAVVHHEPGSAYGISFPDLPGCFSAADEEGDIVAEAQVALGLYAHDHGSELPAARKADAITKEVKDDLSEGAFLMAVPFVLATKKGRYNIMLDPGTVAATDRAAKTQGMSRSEFVAAALADRVAKTTGLVTARDARNTAVRKSRKTAGKVKDLERKKA